MFDRVMNYRYYRLQTRRKDKKESLLYLHRYQKPLDIAMKESKFDGTDPILILEFLTRYVEETDKLGMTEAQAFALVPNYLSGEARRHVRSNMNSSANGGVSCWAQFVDHMLREYATPTALQEAISSLKNIQQKSQETEVQFAARVKDAAYRCGNVHDEIDRMGFFVNGLSPRIRPAVEQLREETPRDQLTFAKLVQKARTEGTMYRARGPNVRFARTDNSGKKLFYLCLLYTSPSPRDRTRSRMPSSA